MLLKTLTTTGLSLGLCASLHAQTPLFDFETSDAQAAWRAREGGAVSLSTAYPSQGRQSLRFTHPKWGGNVQIWPAFEAPAPITDWQAYDRLAMDVFNNGPATFKFNIQLRGEGNTKVYLTNVLLPFQSVRLVMPLDAPFERGTLDRGDVRMIHFYSENPPEAMDIHLDHLTLYRPDETIPPIPAAFQEKTTAAVAEQVGALRQLAGDFLADIHTEGLPNAQRDFIASRLEATQQLLAPGADGRDTWLELMSRFRSQALARSSRAIHAFEAQRPAFALSDRFGDVTLGFAHATEKVVPRAAGFSALPQTVALSAARREHESFQLVVLPTGSDLATVQVTTTAFQAAEAHLPTSAVTVVPVGYVQTAFVPPTGTPYVGFWPDPLLDFLPEVAIQSGDAQAFWIRISVPEAQPAGTYHGAVQVTIEGEQAFRVPVTVQVRDFTLPRTAPLPLIASFGFNPPRVTTAANRIEWAKNPLYPLVAWERHRDAWIDTLADYYITFDFLYGRDGWTPDFEALVRLKEQGRLGLFNLGYYVLAQQDPANRHGMQRTIDRIRRNYDKARELGLLEHAYIYGCDEVPEQHFDRVERATAILKAEFPDVLFLTTTYDDSFGQSGAIPSMDAFCPLTPVYDLERVAAARANGTQVWWYVCVGPTPPYANFFIESDAIEGRLLMGAMTAKYRPDGFLYYRINNWNNPLPITQGPFTDWNPNSFSDYNGDGSWTCVGPDGTPLVTLRLENFRDGLEDFAYVTVLEEKLAATDSASPWAAEARAALDVPTTLVEDLVRYSRNPTDLEAWRSRIADLIETAPRIAK